MKILAAVCAVLLAVPAVAAAPSLEALKAASDPTLSRALPPDMPRFQPSSPEPIVLNPQLQTLKRQSKGAQIARVALAPLLDRQRDAVVRQLGGSVWNIGAAADPRIDAFYATFQQGSKLIVRPLGDIQRLRGKGIDVAIEPGLSYNFRVAPNVFDPVRKSKLQITPINGTPGPGHEMRTGEVMEALKARALVFHVDKWEFWMGYTTDVDPASSQLAGTRSLVFFYEDGMNSKVWPVPEASLPFGAAVEANLGGTRIILIRQANGELIIQRL